MQAASKDSYWKFLGHFEGRTAARYRSKVRQAGYKLKTYATDYETRKYLARIKLGLLCYDSCSTSELEKFAKARNVHDDPEKLSRDVLIKRLMLADDNRKFPRFMELPPELRNSIYELVMADYPKPLTNPAQPPLALVSRQVRKEALSTFYTCCSFQIVLRAKGIFYDRFALSLESHGFLNSLRALDVARLPCLRILVHGAPLRNCIGREDFVVRIEKYSGEKYTAEVEALRDIQRDYRNNACWGARSCARFKSCLENFLTKRNLATGKEKLTLGHIYEVRRHIEHFNAHGRIII
ncbi:hypothetical protein AC578_8882 [Pseudocercospora eumusae]|uniref:F-box domain-containing protein n=1 Tax=Pseudocercospora eumusae TaxID=321146 RepID=A0A139HBJ1_9PEZI|nr:hypothetical protein AC578_8882 [Pseudocercospora eumusae]